MIKVLTTNSNANVKTGSLNLICLFSSSSDSMAAILNRIYFKGILVTAMKLYNEIYYKINPGPIAR